MNVDGGITAYQQELFRAQQLWPQLLAGGQSRRGFLDRRCVRSVITIGSGCSAPVAKFAERVFASRGGAMARTCTPYEVVRSHMTPDLACIISAQGEHPDVLECFEALEDRRIPTIVLTLNSASRLVSRCQKAGDGVELFSWGDFATTGEQHGFIPVLPPLALALMLRAYSNDLSQTPEAADKLFDLAAELDRMGFENQDVDWPGHITIVCGGWAEGAARDLETRLAESGVQPPTICDPWNFAHGRYMAVSRSNSKVLLMGVVEENGTLDHIRKQVPPHLRLPDIVAPMNGFWGGMYCIIRSMLLTARLTALHGIDPAVPDIPRWGDLLYHRGVK